MTVVTFPVPEVQILADDIALSLDSSTTVLLTTVATVDRMLAELHKARALIVAQQTARSARMDRDCAEAMSLQVEAEHVAWGGTLRGWPPIPVLADDSRDGAA